MLSERNQWRVRRIVAGLYWSVAATLVVIVIPPVMMDAFPKASPAAAGLAFAISAILNACLGFSVANPDVPLPGSRKEGIRARSGLYGLLLGLVLGDGASAFLAHGPALRTASVAMFACSGADMLGAVVLFAAFIAGLLGRTPTVLFTDARGWQTGAVAHREIGDGARFEDAAEQFREFLQDHGGAGPLAWITPGDVRLWFGQLLIRPSAEAEARARRVFDEANRRGAGVAIESLARLDHSICCAVAATEGDAGTGAPGQKPLLTLKVREQLATAAEPTSFQWRCATRLASKQSQAAVRQLFSA
jgi:hypothetical protein